MNVLKGNPFGLRHHEQGKRVARFTMATNEHYKNSEGERITNTEWHTIIAWGKPADIIEGFVAKGLPSKGN